jgi:hypothetical protein
MPDASPQKIVDAFSREISDALGLASRRLVAAGYFGAAEKLLIDAWKETGKRQRVVDYKIYRAAIAFYLAELYYRRNDKGAAFWWQLHALVDDYLEGSNGGGARIFLETILGVPFQQFFSNLNQIVKDNGVSRQNPNTVWSVKEGFAEDVVTKLAIRHPEYASMFAYPTSAVEFPISPGYLNCLLGGIDDDSEGKNLEHLACYLFLHLPGCTPSHNLHDSQQTWQTDIMIRNLAPRSDMLTELLGRYFVVECKNWADLVGSAECGYFLQRIQLMHSSFGMILAKNGVTGSGKHVKDGKEPGDERAARQLIRRSFHENGVTCIVLDQAHLKKLENETSLLEILFKEIEDFRFGKSQSSAPYR